jgi:hypothetical protein
MLDSIERHNNVKKNP